jgi:hypothetical protein
VCKGKKKERKERKFPNADAKRKVRSVKGQSHVIGTNQIMKKRSASERQLLSFKETHYPLLAYLFSLPGRRLVADKLFNIDFSEP